MVSQFAWIRTPKILFGAGGMKKLPALIKNSGGKVLILTGSRSFLQNRGIDELAVALGKERMSLHFERIGQEPETGLIDRITARFRNIQLQAVVAIGGGSVLDAGKAVSAMLPLESPVQDYLEGIGTKSHPGIKKYFVAIPTTAGTGSEVTANAVISGTASGTGFKKSLRHENLVPDLAVVDPELAINCPAHITAASGMDALTQLIESYLSVKAGSLTDALALDGIRQADLYLYEAFRNGENLEARSGMAYAAMLSGMTLANSGLGLVHGFASSVGGLFNVPHGIICATLLGTVYRYNLQSLSLNKNGDPATEKYIQLGRLLSGAAGKEKLWYMQFTADYLDNLTDKLQINKLGTYGITRADLEKIASITDHKSNPVQFEKEQLVEMLKTRL